MKLSTHYYLSKIRNKDVADYLKEQIFNGHLEEKYVPYLVKNIATNAYIAQNMVPVCEALARGKSIGEIEATARLLPDACTQSIFALKDGEGDLYNVVPSHLEYLLESKESSAEILAERMGEFARRLGEGKLEKMDYTDDLCDCDEFYMPAIGTQEETDSEVSDEEEYEI